MSLIWATRGRNWGFRFLRNDTSGDPLVFYDTAFSGVEDAPETCRRVGGAGSQPEMVALRFPDPEGRRDRAGRVIPHDFVVFDALVGDVDSVEVGRQRIWPLVADEFARLWELPAPPSVSR
ncbi:hypothetical protein GCM10027451_38080 [Geodermatophilus aquaeductus]|uniref:Uncharacterized protein n=1 Tax=Geodermatophilus aquaeductus TaxID=1564161 RepID=A0A521FD72_9ACTN|nr:hypothetical protein [Geodermatophilus aquaeductus]SMO94132.1 hypothetical protein SAMN06273567_10866 [Geodermatophilus aquaeductus]